MIRKMTWLIILVIMLTHICTIGYAYESILVNADDSKEVLISKTNSKTVANKPKEDDLKAFLNKNNIHTVDDYSQWVNKNMRYEKSNGSEKWESWQATLNRRYGDCKNLSVLNAKVLELLGYHPILIGYKKDVGGHLFTVFLKDGTYHIFDNTDYYVSDLRNVADIGAFLYRKYNVESVFEVSLTTRQITPLLTRSMLLARRR